jgi:hypothetical protein
MERWSIYWKATIAKPKATDQEERANLLSLLSFRHSAVFLSLLSKNTFRVLNRTNIQQMAGRQQEIGQLFDG